MNKLKLVAIGILTTMIILGGTFAFANHAGYLPNQDTIYTKPPATSDDLPSSCITNTYDNNDDTTSNMPEEPQKQGCSTDLIQDMRQRLTMLQNLTWNIYRTSMPIQDVMTDYHSQLTSIGYGPYMHDNMPVQGMLTYHNMPIGYAVYTKGLLIVDAIIALQYTGHTCILYITGDSLTCKHLLDQAKIDFPEIFNQI